ncbi:MAG: alpha/beta hydrolase [Verrucomicrobiota bacterium]|nr:alpha/beta hydrolase [Verrucomicrobiota bacterium]
MPANINPLTPEQLVAILDGQGHEPCPGVEITFDVELRAATVDVPRQYGTLFRPTNRPSSPAAGLLAFHGGGFSAGDPNGCGAVAKMLALTLGVTTLSASYRLATESTATYPAVGDDIVNAWRWFHGQASALGVDPTRIAVCGESAGCWHAGHLAVRSPWVSSALVALPQPAALISQWGPLDFVARWYDNGENPGAERSLLGCSYPENPTRYHQASVLTHATHSLPPALFIYGRRDPVVHPRQGRLALAAWQAIGAHAELLILDNIGHGVTEDNREQRRQLLEKIVAFSAWRYVG